VPVWPRGFNNVAACNRRASLICRSSLSAFIHSNPPSPREYCYCFQLLLNLLRRQCCWVDVWWIFYGSNLLFTSLCWQPHRRRGSLLHSLSCFHTTSRFIVWCSVYCFFFFFLSDSSLFWFYFCFPFFFLHAIQFPFHDVNPLLSILLS